MVHAQTPRHQLLQFLIARFLHVLADEAPLGVVGRVEQRTVAAVLSLGDDCAPRFASVFARVHEHHCLVACLQALNHLLVADIVHDVLGLQDVALGHAHKLHLQGNGAVGGVEVEQARVHAQERGHVAVVGQRGRQSHDADHALTRLHLALSPRHERLDDSPSLIIQQVHLVDDEQTDQGRHCRIRTLAGDDVPLLGRGHQHLGLLHLLLRQLHISRELLDHQPERAESMGESSSDLSRQRFHGGHIHDFEVVDLNHAVLHVGADLVQHGHHGNVGLSCSRGSTHQHILVAAKCSGIDFALDTVERLVAFKGDLCPVWHLRDLDECLVGTHDALLHSWHEHLFVLLVDFAGGSLGQGATSAQTVTIPNLHLYPVVESQTCVLCFGF
mmetsp:Transcript_17116/g.51222  ORF Transcript_17116/g.51222 Transcript_17116/m.51222 type:complete len:386 (+) Transcript_17116:2827-3984(+)